MKDSFEKTDKVALEGKAFLTDADLEQVAGGNAVPEDETLAMLMDAIGRAHKEGSEEEILKAYDAYVAYKRSSSERSLKERLKKFGHLN